MTLRAGFLLAALTPYVYFGLRDNLHHFRHRHDREVSLTERVLHGGIVISLCTVIPHAILGNTAPMLVGLVFFIAVRGLDEFWFHRGLPGSESDLHAKTHLAFLVFLTCTMAAEHWM